MENVIISADYFIFITMNFENQFLNNASVAGKIQS